MRWLIGLLTAVYPLLVYFGLMRFSAAALAGLLALLAGLRLVAAPGHRRRMLPLVLGIIAFAVAVMVTDSQLLLRCYPVLANLALLAWFGYTLWSPPSAIERFADAMGMQRPAEATPYLVGLTRVWCAFFLVNGLVAAWTAAVADMKTWALYNGLIVYLIIGVIFVVEFLVRRAWHRRLGDV